MAKAVRETLQQHKGERVIIMDMREVTLIADYFVIASGQNPTQVTALADHTEAVMAKLGAILLNPGRHGKAHWILMDYGTVVVHLFTEDERQYYNLERFWGDADIVPDVVPPKEA